MTRKYYYRVEASMKGYKASGTSGMSKAVSGYPVRTTNILSVVANEQGSLDAVSYTHLDVYKRQEIYTRDDIYRLWGRCQKEYSFRSG